MYFLLSKLMNSVCSKYLEYVTVLQQYTTILKSNCSAVVIALYRCFSKFGYIQMHVNVNEGYTCKNLAS